MLKALQQESAQKLSKLSSYCQVPHMYNLKPAASVVGAVHQSALLISATPAEAAKDSLLLQSYVKNKLHYQSLLVGQ